MAIWSWRRRQDQGSGTNDASEGLHDQSNGMPALQRRRSSFYTANAFFNDTLGFRIRKQIYKAEKILGPILSKLIPNFIVAHYVYICSIVIICSIFIYPQKNISYIDSLFFASGSATQAGLNTVDTNDLTLFQQMVIYIFTMISTPIFIHSSLTFLRLWQFEKSFDDIKEKSKLNFKMRRTATLAAMRTYTMDNSRTYSNIPPHIKGDNDIQTHRNNALNFQKTYTSTFQNLKAKRDGYGTHNGSEDLVRRLNRYQKDNEMSTNMAEILEEGEDGIPSNGAPDDDYNNVAHYSEPSDSEEEEDDNDNQHASPRDSNTKDIKFATLPRPQKRSDVAPRDLYMSISMMQQQQPNELDDDDDESGPALKIKGPVERIKKFSGKSLKHRRDRKLRELKKQRHMRSEQDPSSVDNSETHTPEGEYDDKNSNGQAHRNVSIQFEEPSKPRKRPQPPTFSLNSPRTDSFDVSSTLKSGSQRQRDHSLLETEDDNDLMDNDSDLSAEFNSDEGPVVSSDESQNEHDSEAEVDNSFGDMVGRTRSQVITRSSNGESQRDDKQLKRAATVDIGPSSQTNLNSSNVHHSHLHLPSEPAVIKSMTFDKMIKKKMSKRKRNVSKLSRKITRTLSGPIWLRSLTNATTHENEDSDSEEEGDYDHDEDDDDDDDYDDIISEYSTQYRVPTNYLSWNPTIGRNSMFVVLTDDQKEELGGVEYRALKLLSKILICYYVGFHLIALIMLLPYIIHHSNYSSILRSDGVTPVWWGFFTPASAFNDLGFTLTPDSMMKFDDNPYILMVMSFFIVIGNSGFPIFLRFLIWVLYKISKPLTIHKESLTFLLDHPRRCFTLLFPAGPTWWLFFVLIVLNSYDWFLFLILDFHDSSLKDISPGYRCIDGLFQAFSTRTAGFNVVNIANLHPAIQVSYLVMMYISVLPLAISIRRTNVYEEQSLGIYVDKEDDSSTNEGKAMSFIGTHLRKQLSFDLWFVFLGLFIICIVEKNRLEAGDLNFSIFSCLFEIISAYGTVGMSLGYPTSDTSFCGQFRIISKLVIIAMMIRGRHRGLPYNIDRAIMLSTDNIRMRDDYQTHHHLKRTNTLAQNNSVSLGRRESTIGGPGLSGAVGRNSTFESANTRKLHDADNGMNDLPFEQTAVKLFNKASAGAGKLMKKVNKRRNRKSLPHNFSFRIPYNQGDEEEELFKDDYNVSTPSPHFDTSHNGDFIDSVNFHHNPRSSLGEGLANSGVASNSEVPLPHSTGTNENPVQTTDFPEPRLRSNSFS